MRVARKVAGGAIVLSVVLLLIAYSVAFIFPGAYLVIFTPKDYLMSGVVDSVTEERLRAIEVGDDELQIEDLLGKPFRRIEYPDRFLALYYSMTIEYAFFQPNVRIVLNHGFVSSVEVERASFWGDEFRDYYYKKSKYGTVESDNFSELF